jgi:hypothetical protein
MKLGTYKHYKGKYYQVIGIAKHSETLEELVTYYCLYQNDNGQLWVRPREMFEGNVAVDGNSIPRFVFVKE